MKWPVLGRIVLYVVLGLVAYHYLTKGPEPADQNAIADTKAWLTAAQAYHTTAQKLKAVAVTNRRLARASADSAHAAMPHITCDDHLPICPAVDTSRTSLRAERDSAFRAANLWQRAFHQMALADFADSSRADSLQQLLDVGLKPIQGVLHAAQCKILFVPCPTRTQSFVVGVLAGVAIIAWNPRLRL